MQHFAGLLNNLLYTPQRNGKFALIGAYLRHAPDPDRGYALAALTGELSLKHAKAAAIRRLIEARTDPELFRLSYDFVGDLAETAALLWPTASGAPPPRLSEVIETLQTLPRTQIEDQLATWLDRLDADGRWALLKLLTGGLRVGVSARLAKIALAHYGQVGADEIEEIWHGLEPPYTPLFAWLNGQAGRPDFSDLPVFRPLMLANPIEARELAALNIEDYAIEWKWDGIRVQIAAKAGDVRLYSRSGDDISKAFPDIVEPIADHRLLNGVADGELLVRGDAGAPAGFNDLQQRLNRKTVSKAMLKRFPAFVRLYDLLFAGDVDLRTLPFIERRQQLDTLFTRLPAALNPPVIDRSDLLEPASLVELDGLRRSCRGDLKEGLMLKRKASRYQAGRPRGDWFKWKRDPLNLDCVLMYAQRGHGKRSSFYSDYTFGAWQPDDQGHARLVPVGKAYSGFTDAELVKLDRWIRANTTNRFGPVREVSPGLVFEVGFDSVHRSSRHKSGVAMRFPRILRIRWDKRPDEADQLATLAKLIAHGG